MGMTGIGIAVVSIVVVTIVSIVASFELAVVVVVSDIDVEIGMILVLASPISTVLNREKRNIKTCGRSKKKRKNKIFFKKKTSTPTLGRVKRSF
jgi:hypothetical protein